MIHRPLILFISLLLSLAGFAQLRISGLVEHEGHPLTDVIIKIEENGKVKESVEVNRKGKYLVELDFDRKYTLIFTRPYMFPVSIDVNSEVIRKHNSAIEYEVPLNMVMFYRYEGLSDLVTKESIGTIKITGSGEESFSFVPNADVIERLKPLQKESLKREANNVQPSNGNGAKDVVSSTTPVESNTEPENNVEKTPITKPEVKEDAPHSVNRADFQQMRYAAIEEAKTIETNEAKQSEQRKSGAQTQSALEAKRYLEESKMIRAEFVAEDQARERAIMEARAKKQEAALMLASGVLHPSPISRASNLILLSHAVNDGVFEFEEMFIVQEGNTKHQYKKVIYNCVLFDVTYYTRDQAEISQNEYESIKKQLDI